MDRVQRKLDPAPSSGHGSATSTDPLMPAGSLDFAGSTSNAASGALGATVHLLQTFNSPSSRATAGDERPFASAELFKTVTMASPDAPLLQRRKLCFVTVGATAPFDKLIQAVQSPRFISTLEAAGFTNLLLQHGHAGDVVPSKDQGGVRITSFDFRKDGIQREITSAKGDMRKARAEAKGGSKPQLEGLDFGAGWQNATWEEGVVISHAGSGSILDALRVSVPLIVVPNESLLDNHQVDLARELEKQGYVVHGQIARLAEALAAVETKRQTRKQWPPPPNPNDKGGRGLIGIMDEEMGYTSLSVADPTKASKLYLD